MTGGAAPVNNTPTPQTVESPITEPEPLLENGSIQALGGLVKKVKEKIQNRQITGNESIRDSINDVVFSESPNTLQSPVQSSIEDLLNGESSTDAISDAILKSTPNDENLFECLGSDIKNGWQNLINSGQNIFSAGELENILMPQGDLIQVFVTWSILLLLIAIFKLICMVIYYKNDYKTVTNPLVIKLFETLKQNKNHSRLIFLIIVTLPYNFNTLYNMCMEYDWLFHFFLIYSCYVYPKCTNSI